MKKIGNWAAGPAPVSVVMISLNEGHNMSSVLENLSGWAEAVYLVDSFSQDETIEVALDYGVHVVQRAFYGFGEQWNFALSTLPINTPWTMKLDPDERLTDGLKDSLTTLFFDDLADAACMTRRLWFMGTPLPVSQELVRVWRTGSCVFTDVKVNEHPIVKGYIKKVVGNLEHHDSPNLHHWLAKQNEYTTTEANAFTSGEALSASPKFFGSALERRMWLKKNIYRFPFRYQVLFAYHYLIQGAWKCGRVGYIWARLRCDVIRLIEYKSLEIVSSGTTQVDYASGVGLPDPRVKQFERS